jgi:hypothetical protein
MFGEKSSDCPGWLSGEVGNGGCDLREAARDIAGKRGELLGERLRESATAQDRQQVVEDG